MRLMRAKRQESCCSFWKTYGQSAYSSRGRSHHHYGSARCSDAGLLQYSVGDFHAEPAVLQWVRENIPGRGTVIDRQTEHGVCLASLREKESHGVGRMILVDVPYPVAVLMDDMNDACGRKMLCYTQPRCARAIKVYAIFTRGIFSGAAISRNRNSASEALSVTNTAPEKDKMQHWCKIQVVDISVILLRQTKERTTANLSLTYSATILCSTRML